MQKTVLVFDLDDTLYDELSYVLSGFSAVSKFLKETKGLSAKTTFSTMKNLLETEGRGHIFDNLLKKYGIYTKTLLKQCIHIYRHHIPKIELDRDAVEMFKRYKKSPIYLVTDGHKIVQDLKIKALKLDKKMKYCYLTNRFGIKNQKPSPHCFLLICKKEKVLPEQVIYIADNPSKDFIGIKPLSFQTVRILRGRYKDITLDAKHEADRTIKSLNEI